MEFNGVRLRLARRFKNLTVRELADLIAVSHPLISDYEKGVKEPKDDVLDALAVALDVLPEFFVPRNEEEFTEDETNFRRRIQTTERFKKRVLAHASLFAIAVQFLRQKVRFPEIRMPDFPAQSADDAERVAEAARDFWGIGLESPIGNVTRVLENAGVVCVKADIETARRIDAFSRFGDVSVVVLNSEKESSTRSRFDTAHETGHGVMHSAARHLPIDRREAEADRFAGALLMPRAAFTQDFYFGDRSDWAHLFDLKSRWGASVAAVVRRAYQLGLIDAVEYRTRFRAIGRNGWTTEEPQEPVHEEPELFRLALVQYRKDFGKSVTELASQIGWKPGFFTLVTGVESDVLMSPNVVSLSDFRQRQVASG